ncbi:VIR protein [Plasmodium vivax]|uniref:VIR protein n=1 Tax=Plasmodium vivax TaxID=5855 RepID=A0A1G4EA65_PLAVI|nr:VIR protein [Plasmodium vivax]
MPLFDWNICKPDLPSTKLYNTWNSKLFSISLDKECILAKSDYTGDKNDILVKICSMALEYLRKDDELPPKKRLSSCNRCKLFNFWVHEKLQETFKEDHRTAFNYLTFMMGKDNIVSNYLKGNACKIDFYIATDTELNVKKQFYEYIEDYHQIDIRSKLSYPECIEYKEYFKNRHSLRKYIIKILPEVENQNFSAIYGTNNNCNTTNILTKLIDSDIDFSEGEEEDSEKSVDGLSFLDAVYNIKKELLNYELTQNPFSYLKLQWDYGINKLKNSSPYAMPSILSVTGVSAASMIFYRFTPLGTLLRRQNGSKNLNIHNFSETYAGAFPNSYEGFANENSANDPINIGYHPE